MKHRSIDLVSTQISRLFRSQTDLISEFACFLPEKLAQRLQFVLHDPLLPHVINLGRDGGDQLPGHVKMTAEEVQQLALRLQSQPHVTDLQLWGHEFGPEGMRLLAGPIAMQTSLQILDLGCT